MAAITKYQRLSGLNNRNFFLNFWRLEVQDQGVGSVGFFWGLSTWPVDGRLIPVSLCVYALISSYKDNSMLN